LVTPILWKLYSWEIDDYKITELEKKLFNTILSCLPSSSKQELSHFGVKLSSDLSKPPLLNYISFCQFPNAKKIDKIVHSVLESLDKYNGRDLLEREIYKLFVANIRAKELRWETSQPLSLFPKAFECFSQLNSLSINVECVSSDILREMGQICKNLIKLIIYKCYLGLPGLISLIDAQKNLREVYIYDRTGKKLGDALERKGNTINHIYLDLDDVASPSFLTSLVNLKSITLYNGNKKKLNKEVIKNVQKYLSISKFPHLQVLNIKGLSCFKELSKLIEKTEGDISEIYIENNESIQEFDDNTRMLINSITNYCPKIKILRTYLESKDFIYVKSLLLNCKYLKCVKFYNLDNNNNNNHHDNNNTSNNNIGGDELLNILSKFSPESLNEIIISGNWKFSIEVFERFFESFRERNPLYFSIDIHNGKHYVTEDHKAIIKKYINEGVIIG